MVRYWGLLHFAGTTRDASSNLCLLQSIKLSAQHTTQLLCSSEVPPHHHGSCNVPGYLLAIQQYREHTNTIPMAVQITKPTLQEAYFRGSGLVGKIPTPAIMPRQTLQKEGRKEGRRKVLGVGDASSILLPSPSSAVFFYPSHGEQNPLAQISMTSSSVGSTQLHRE